MLQQLLDSYRSVSLEQMGKVKLMNRVDTKFVTTLDKLEQLLQMASDRYSIQEIEGRQMMPYTTLYFDTPVCEMFAEHQRGKKARQKIRIRRYESSGIAFLEVKRKNNKGRTDKKRMQVGEHTPDLDCEQYRTFLIQKSRYGAQRLLPQLSNAFHRITLVNDAMTERLTIDLDLRFHNEQTGQDANMGPLVIIEVKRDGLTYSPILAMLKQLRIHQSGFSKYCIGMSLTNPNLKSNRFKERLRYVSKLAAITNC
ncbi:MAG: polyphosphate polymerase domain-containing protein [Bacteroides sp.]|nr:polyphosphate polymerase domain-containing protein [Bacteroides sp.]MCM1378942.1 polyphosphate polymerase domain-containing protein [Bacteroides sp.]MCM1445558.1 polyphosphate polymerase domain-containing protein [Prevotella sp.]